MPTGVAKQSETIIGHEKETFCGLSPVSPALGRRLAIVNSLDLLKE